MRALLQQLLQFFRRERLALAALGRFAGDLQVDVLVGLAAFRFAVAFLIAFARIAAGSFDRADEIVADLVGAFERISFAGLARLFDQILDPGVERARLPGAVEDVGARVAQRLEVHRGLRGESRGGVFIGRDEAERGAHQQRAERERIEPVHQREIEVLDPRREAAIVPAQFRIDAGRLAQAHQRAAEAGILEGRHEAIDRLGAFFSALIEAGNIRQVEVEGAELVTARQMRRDREKIVVGLLRIFERIDALGKIDHLPRHQRIMKRKHHRRVGERVDAELERKQHPHEFRYDALDLVQ